MKRILDGQKQNMVGPRIKQLRLEKGMTQKTLAERLETLAVYVCRGSISRIEEQKRTITDIELAGIAEVLQVDISEFFKKDERADIPDRDARSFYIAPICTCNALVTFRMVAASLTVPTLRTSSLFSTVKSCSARAMLSRLSP